MRGPELDRRRHRQQADLDGGHALLHLREVPALRPRERLQLSDVLLHVVELPEAVVDAPPVGAVGRLAVLVAIDRLTLLPRPRRRDGQRREQRLHGLGPLVPEACVCLLGVGHQAIERRHVGVFLPPSGVAKRARGQLGVVAVERVFALEASARGPSAWPRTSPWAPAACADRAPRECSAGARGDRAGCRSSARWMPRSRASPSARAREGAVPTAARSSPRGSSRTCAGPTRRGSRRSPPRRAPSVRGRRPIGRRRARRATRGAAA